MPCINEHHCLRALQLGYSEYFAFNFIWSYSLQEAYWIQQHQGLEDQLCKCFYQTLQASSMPLHLVKQCLVLHFSLSCPMVIRELGKIAGEFPPYKASRKQTQGVPTSPTTSEGRGDCPRPLSCYNSPTDCMACVPQPLISHRSGGWKVKVSFNSQFDVWWQCVQMSPHVEGARTSLGFLYKGINLLQGN